MIRHVHHLEVIGLDGSPLCETCAERLPTIQGRWCGKRCQRDAEQRALPTPTTIAARAAKIRAGWSDRERQKRIAEPVGPVTAPLVAISDLITDPGFFLEV